MRIKILILGLICFISIPFILSQETKVPPPRIQNIQKPHFRQAVWGMNQKQIKKIEKSEFMQKQHSNESGLDILAYKSQAAGLDCVIAYYFAENQLVEGRYIFAESHVNKNLYIDDFDEINSFLKEKYGNPKTDKKIWRDELYKDDPSDWGLAVSIGHLIYESIWLFPETKISHQLFGDNYKITHWLDYKSEIEAHKKLVKELEKRAKEIF